MTSQDEDKNFSSPLTLDEPLPPSDSPDYTYLPRGHATFDVELEGFPLGTIQNQPDGWYLVYRGDVKNGVRLRISRGQFPTRLAAANYAWSLLSHVKQHQ